MKLSYSGPCCSNPFHNHKECNALKLNYTKELKTLNLPSFRQPAAHARAARQPENSMVCSIMTFLGYRQSHAVAVPAARCLGSAPPPEAAKLPSRIRASSRDTRTRRIPPARESHPLIRESPAYTHGREHPQVFFLTSGQATAILPCIRLHLHLMTLHRKIS